MPKDMTFEEALLWFNKNYSKRTTRELLVMKAMLVEIHKLRSEIKELHVEQDLDKPPIDG